MKNEAKHLRRFYQRTRKAAISDTKQITYNDIKAESLAAIAQGNALWIACSRFSPP
jgi:hypothetical protein